jgi:two-component system KDP operon response regulator KdpE
MLGQVALVIADVPQLRRLLRVTLNHEGAQLFECPHAPEAAELVELHHPDLVLLDVSPSDMSGADATLLLRERTQAPIIALSESNEEDHKVAVFDAGADDFLTLPFSRGELLARIRAALRRSLQFRAQEPGDHFRAGALEVDFLAREVKLRGKSIHLTPTEYELLRVLIASAGKVVSHQRLLQEVWGPAFVDQVQYLRVYVKQLRRKLELAPTAPRYLVTEPAVGYRLRIPA